MAALPYLWDFWAMDHQMPPVGDWRAWVVIGGRGAGKTRAGAEWVRSQVEGALPTDKGLRTRVALVADTIDQARAVMIEGESGILACSPPDRRPKWVASKKQLEWPNGAVAQVFSAQDPDALRGPQFDAAWVDEFAKFRRAEDTWDMLQLCLRVGSDPRVVVTTTPQGLPALRKVLNDPRTVKTHAATDVNAANLADSFLADVKAKYAGTRMGRQELAGEILEGVDGALWNRDMFEKRAVAGKAFDRIVVAVDPPVSSGPKADECGIVVVGANMQGPRQMWTATVLADVSHKTNGPNDWAKRAQQAMIVFDADRLVAEVNQGGDMVKQVIHSRDPLIPFRAVHASRGKVARAEPVAALYEQGRISHVAGLDKLEDQMCLMAPQGFQGQGSPDRVDALVWAVTDLLLTGAKNNPGLRNL